VETAGAREIFAAPKHPFTKELVAAAPLIPDRAAGIPVTA
jgi:ABC-type dipeptide/oligopeptide/nickel transport system ATPase component